MKEKHFAIDIYGNAWRLSAKNCESENYYYGSSSNSFGAIPKECITHTVTVTSIKTPKRTVVTFGQTDDDFAKNTITVTTEQYF